MGVWCNRTYGSARCEKSRHRPLLEGFARRCDFADRTMALGAFDSGSDSACLSRIECDSRADCRGRPSAPAQAIPKRTMQPEAVTPLSGKSRNASDRQHDNRNSASLMRRHDLGLPASRFSSRRTRVLECSAPTVAGSPSSQRDPRPGRQGHPGNPGGDANFSLSSLDVAATSLAPPTSNASSTIFA
jgi:hypothetical protein